MATWHGWSTGTRRRMARTSSNQAMLKMLASDPCWKVRRDVAENARTEPDTRVRLALFDPYRGVRKPALRALPVHVRVMVAA